MDERPEEVKQMEAFRSSAKWKLLGSEKNILRKSTGSSQVAVLSEEPEAMTIPLLTIHGSQRPKTALKKQIVVLSYMCSINM